MEVHHHPEVEKKSFKEYLLEFLMIFLAVTLGFFAENIREHFVNKEHEHQYIKSFYEDLSNDEIALPHLIGAIEAQQIRPAVLLPALLSKTDIKTPANDIYYFLRGMVRQQGIHIFITDRTIAQVKNSGEMRLITNREVSDSLIDYYKQIEFVAYLQESLLGIKTVLAQTLRPLFNSSDYDKISDSTDHLIIPDENLYLRSVDPAVINNCLLSVSDVRGLSTVIKNMIVAVKNKASRTKKLIAEKYDVAKEE